MPLDPKLNKFSTISQSLATYDWQDLASGLVYSIFYHFKDGANAYILTDQVVYSDTIGEVKSGGGTLTLTFNSSVFNAPRDLRGTAIISVPLSTSTSATGYATAEVKHYDGTTTTSLGTATGIASAVGVNATKMQTLTIALTEQHFAAGDTLIIVIGIVNTAGGGDLLYTAYDPSSRTYVTASAPDIVYTQMISQIPFRKPN